MHVFCMIRVGVMGVYVMGLYVCVFSIPTPPRGEGVGGYSHLLTYSLTESLTN